MQLLHLTRYKVGKNQFRRFDMSSCANRENNIDSCTCSYSGCSRRGNCCQCVSYHNSRNEIPGCFFSPAGERSYDRSIQNFIKDRSNL